VDIVSAIVIADTLVYLLTYSRPTRCMNLLCDCNFGKHCAGNFTFTSRRHVGCPFSVVLYVNGYQSSRLSACCEYRHSVGSRLGGQHGHFALVSVIAAKPCYRWT